MPRFTTRIPTSQNIVYEGSNAMLAPSEIATIGNQNKLIWNNAGEIDYLSLTGFMRFQGLYDVSTDTPTLADSDAYDAGSFFIISVGGTRDFGSGDIVLNVNDSFIKQTNGIWIKFDAGTYNTTESDNRYVLQSGETRDISTTGSTTANTTNTKYLTLTTDGEIKRSTEKMIHFPDDSTINLNEKNIVLRTNYEINTYLARPNIKGNWYVEDGLCFRSTSTAINYFNGSNITDGIHFNTQSSNTAQTGDYHIFMHGPLYLYSHSLNRIGTLNFHGETTGVQSPAEIQRDGTKMIDFPDASTVNFNNRNLTSVGNLTAGSSALQVENGNVYCGNESGVGSTATDGFLYLPLSHGAQAGTPRTKGNYLPMCYDYVLNRLMICNSGTWHYVQFT